MEHTSDFQLMIGNACIQEFAVMAEVERDTDGDWCIGAVYADALMKDGKVLRGSRDWVAIPADHMLYKPVLLHFLNSCRHDIDERWERHSWRYQPARSLVSAGRTL
jgi:hypothetical protein